LAYKSVNGPKILLMLQTTRNKKALNIDWFVKVLKNQKTPEEMAQWGGTRKNVKSDPLIAGQEDVV